MTPQDLQIRVMECDGKWQAVAFQDAYFPLDYDFKVAETAGHADRLTAVTVLLMRVSEMEKGAANG